MTPTDDYAAVTQWPSRGRWGHHVWEMVGPAPTFAGQQCRLWRCQRCGKEWEIFVGSAPSNRGKCET